MEGVFVIKDLGYQMMEEPVIHCVVSIQNSTHKEVAYVMMDSNGMSKFQDVLKSQHWHALLILFKFKVLVFAILVSDLMLKEIV